MTKQQVLTKEPGEGLAAEFNDMLQKDKSYQTAISKTDQVFILAVEKYMAHNFRYYQKEALAAFEYLVGANDENWFKKNLYEKGIPFYGFEMATGSGKTLLMGALILHLYKNHRMRNFLIIVPSTTIYEKTVQNFDSNHMKKVFSNYMVEKYNLVTGDNFTDKSSNYDPDAAFSIFIFTIQKFFERSIGEQVLKVDKVWEESPWKSGGNTISFREYLTGQGLVVLTDEAHHYQHYRVGQVGNKSSGDVIADFKPEMVLEFTATAVTDDPSQSRRNQKIIYDYTINRFLSDGYGKKVRAFGYTGGVDVRDDSSVSEEDKRKFLVAFLIHQLKKKALKLAEPNSIKPILLVRARDTTHADNLLPVIEEEVPKDEELINAVYGEITGGHKYDVTEMVQANVTLEEFKKALKELRGKAFVYHSGNDSDPEVRRKIETIESNEQEVLIQIKKLEEGWDLQNPYTILILSNSTSPFVKTYVRQLIGRGVRLFREKREKGDLAGMLDEHQEVLHVVCNRGTSFHEFIEDIRQEMGLSRENLEEEKHTVQINNRIQALVGQYSGLKLPEVTVVPTFQLSAEQLVEKLDFSGLELQQWFEEHTMIIEGKRYWRITEEDKKIEISISEEIDLDRGQAKYEPKPIELEPKEIRTIVRYVIDNQSVLPSVSATRQRLIDAIGELKKKDLMYKHHNPSSRANYVAMLSYSLRNHLVKVINSLFTEERREEEKDLHQWFQEEGVRVEQDPATGKNVGIIKWSEVPDKDNVTSKFLRGKLITGFKKSWFDYNSFDAGPEFRLAIVLDSCPDVEFWIRNQRQFRLRYGSHMYHPDFIVFSGSKLWLVEPKGSDRVETERVKQEINLLRKMAEKGYGAVFLLDTTIESKIYKRAHTFKDMVDNSDLPKMAIWC